MEKIVKGLETRLIHAGEPEPRIGGAVSMPIFQSSTFEYGGQASYHDLKYIRLNNTPNHTALHQKLAAIENAPAALVAASGMAAISATLLTVLKSGDHLLAQNCLYGGTHNLLTDDFRDLGITFDFIDGDNPASWRGQIRPNTRAIYVEAISNPLLEVADLKAAVQFARVHGLVSIIDNTCASPVNFRPSEIGFDLSLHSATKYLNGHDDIVAGAVIGRTDLVRAVTLKLNHLGGSLDPHACFLLHRGIKTLAVRVRYQNESALRIARFLEAAPASHARELPRPRGPSAARARPRTVRRLRRADELRAGRWRRRSRAIRGRRNASHLRAVARRRRYVDSATGQDLACRDVGGGSSPNRDFRRPDQALGRPRINRRFDRGSGSRARRRVRRKRRTNRSAQIPRYASPPARDSARNGRIRILAP